MDGTVVRRGGPADFEPAVEVWRAANEARMGGRASPPPVQVERLHAAMRDPASFLFVADEGGISGMAVGMQGLAADGAEPPIQDLCHVGAVFVAPGRWGAGLGGELVGAVLSEARSRGYGRAQLWTHADNRRAQRLYENRGFRCTGREKQDDLGETIVHYERWL
jgi:GNAT superfamily N-acetyltransferase